MSFVLKYFFQFFISDRKLYRIIQLLIKEMAVTEIAYDLTVIKMELIKLQAYLLKGKQVEKAKTGSKCPLNYFYYLLWLTLKFSLMAARSTSFETDIVG